MFVTLIAVLCNTLPGPRLCVEEVVTDSSISEITFMSCQVQGQIGIAQWMSESLKYREHWMLDRYKCVTGKYQPKGRA